MSAKRTTTTKPLTTNTPHEPSQPTACYVAESSPAPYTNAGVDVALANVIGATFFAVLVLFGFYAVYRGFQSRERAKRRIASDIIRVLKEDEERAVKYKVLQLTQPGGEVAAAMRCRDEEQVPGAPGGPTVDDDVGGERGPHGEFTDPGGDPRGTDGEAPRAGDVRPRCVYQRGDREDAREEERRGWRAA